MATFQSVVAFPCPDGNADGETCRDELELRCLERGNASYLINGQHVSVGPGRLCIFWTAIPHRVWHSEETHEVYVVKLSLRRFLRWSLPADFVDSLLQGELILERQEESAGWDKLVLRQWARDLVHPHPKIEKAVHLEMEARLLRLASNLSTNPLTKMAKDHSTRGMKKAAAVKMTSYVAGHYGTRLSVEEIADAGGLCVKKADEAFRELFSLPLEDYLVRYRVAHAQRLLVRTALSFTEVAVQSGFISRSHFTRLFTVTTGMCPIEYRQHNGRDSESAPL